jgi:hypothetical protein
VNFSTDQGTTTDTPEEGEGEDDGEETADGEGDDVEGDDVPEETATLQ